jgi:UDP-N-acetyl-2-amino-2-deoxyglucuronate dehydrogenase
VTPKNFAMLGVAGYIAPRHLKAIRDTGNRLVAACDPNESVGVLDRFFFDTRYFREFERFDRHVEKLRRRGEGERVDYVSICSPNYLHDAHIRFALRVGAHAVCEKPLVINPWNLEPLAELEAEHGRRVFTVLQLRLHPALRALKARLYEPASDRGPDRGLKKHDVVLTYVTARGPWYLNTWKGSVERSGGIATNIGIHFFDLLIWLFGRPHGFEVHAADPERQSGYLDLERATVRWYLSIDRNDLPLPPAPGGVTTHRSITVDGAEVEFTEGFADLHTEVYRHLLDGPGFGIEDARPSIVLTSAIRQASPVGRTARSHDFLTRRR